MIFLIPLILFKAGINSRYEISSNSLIWSVPKHKWLKGPKIEKTKYRFINACALAINVSSVLFIGLSTNKNTGFDGFDNLKYTPNDITAIYNFKLNKWQQQDSLYFKSSFEDNDFEYSYELSCSVVHEKTRNRLEIIIIR